MNDWRNAVAGIADGWSWELVGRTDY